MGVLRQAQPPGRREPGLEPRRRILPPLLLGFGVAAVGVYALASAVGSSVRAHLDLPWTLLMLLVLAGCATADLAFPHLRCSLVRRQTPQSLLSVVPAPIGGFLWGLDIGSVVSTYRASAATWAGLLLGLAGWGPWWS